MHSFLFHITFWYHSERNQCFYLLQCPFWDNAWTSENPKHNHVICSKQQRYLEHLPTGLVEASPSSNPPAPPLLNTRQRVHDEWPGGARSRQRVHDEWPGGARLKLIKREREGKENIKHQFYSISGSLKMTFTGSLKLVLKHHFYSIRPLEMLLCGSSDQVWIWLRLKVMTFLEWF
jgi:hypothetical protein